MRLGACLLKSCRELYMHDQTHVNKLMFRTPTITNVRHYTSMDSLGNIISAARKAADLTQPGLAGKLGVHPLAVSRWERNAVLPSMEHRMALVDLLGIDPDDLGIPRVAQGESAMDTQARLKRIEAMLERLVEDCENKPNGDANGHAAAR